MGSPWSVALLRHAERPCFCKEKQGPTCYAGVGMRVTVTAM